MIRRLKKLITRDMVRPLLYKVFTRGILALFAAELVHFFAPSEWPAVEHPVTKGRTGYHIRDGRHEILLYDWLQYLAFADRFLQ